MATWISLQLYVLTVLFLSEDRNIWTAREELLLEAGEAACFPLVTDGDIQFLSNKGWIHLTGIPGRYFVILQYNNFSNLAVKREFLWGFLWAGQGVPFWFLGEKAELSSTNDMCARNFSGIAINFIYWH